MAISRDEVKRIAELARLEIPEAKLDRLAGELSKVLDFASTLRSLDLAGFEISQFAPPAAPLREDAVNGRRLKRDAALAEHRHEARGRVRGRLSDRQRREDHLPEEPPRSRAD